MGAVREVLGLLDAEKKPSLLVLNKKDRTDAGTLESLGRKYPEAVAVSALSGEGLAVLVDRLGVVLGQPLREVRIQLAGKDLAWVDEIYRSGQVVKRWNRGSGVEILARIPARLYGQLAKSGLV